MNITHHENPDVMGYFSLVEKKYGTQKNYAYFLNDLKAALAFSGKYQKPVFIVVKNGDAIIGHCALILDSGLKQGEAFFGFFDVVDDMQTFNSLWRYLIDLAKSKGVTTLKGPINASGWHQYRAMSHTDNSDFFKSELFCESYYYDFLKACKPSNEILYHSGYREGFRFVILITRGSYKTALEQGFVIEEAKNIDLKYLKDVLEISKTVFKDSWGYTDLSIEDFVSLYSGQKLDTHLNKIYFMKKDDKVVGYLSTFIEDDKTLIFKTIAILPEFQGQGLANALIYKAHRDASDEGYKKVIYALIRKDNKIKNFRRDGAVAFREYSTFEFQI